MAQQFVAANCSVQELLAQRQSFVPRRSEAPLVAPVRVDVPVMQQLPVLTALR
jgi:hypothetical protein